jgi:hypothetical protein
MKKINLKKGNRFTMYYNEKKWYDKKDVLGIFPISERTYFTKIKNLDERVRIEVRLNPNGKKTKLIFFEDLLDVFQVKRTPKNINHLNILSKYIGTKKWDFIGNIIPEKSTISDLQNKMNFLFENLKKLDRDSELFYSIEKNSKDNYFHSHILINSKLSRKVIIDFLSLITEENTPKITRMFLKEYDYKHYHFRGSFYSFKDSQFNKLNVSLFHKFLR